MSSISILAGFFCLVLAGTAKADPAADYVEHYSKALKGNVQSQLVIGRLLLEGPEPVQRDASKGIQLLEKAASAGNLDARRYLIAAYLAGRFTTKNVAAALRLMQPLAQKEKEEASRFLQIADGSSASAAAGNPSTCKLVDQWYREDGSFVDQKTDCVIAGQYDGSSPEQVRLLIKPRAKTDQRALQRFVNISLTQLGTAGVGNDLHLVLTSLKFPEKEKLKVLGDKGAVAVANACVEFVDNNSLSSADRAALCSLAAALNDKASIKIVAYRKLDGEKPFIFDSESALPMLVALAETDLDVRADLSARAIRQRNFPVLLRLAIMNRGQPMSEGQRVALETLKSWLGGYKTDLSSISSSGEKAWLCREIFKLDQSFNASVYAELERSLGDQQMRECMPVEDLSLVDREKLREARSKLSQRRTFDVAVSLATDKVEAEIQSASPSPSPATTLKKPSQTTAPTGTEKEILKLAASYLIDGRCGEVAELLSVNPGYLDRLIPMVSGSDCAKSNTQIAHALLDYQVRRGDYRAATDSSSSSCDKGELSGCQKVVEWFLEGKGKIPPLEAQRAASIMLRNSSRTNSTQKLLLIDYAYMTKEPFLKERLREDWLAQIHFGERNPKGTLRYIFFEMPSGLQRLVDRERVQDLCATFQQIAPNLAGVVDVDFKNQLSRTCSQ